MYYRNFKEELQDKSEEYSLDKLELLYDINFNKIYNKSDLQSIIIELIVLLDNVDKKMRKDLLRIILNSYKRKDL